MSKKQLNSRLENLFATLGEQENPLSTDLPGSLPVWTWEANAKGFYTNCSPEVTTCLGIQAKRFIGKKVVEFAVAPQSQTALANVFSQAVFPAELDMFFQSFEGASVPVRMMIHARMNEQGGVDAWHGLVQVTGKTTEPVSTINSPFIIPTPHPAKPEPILPAPVQPAPLLREVEPIQDSHLHSIDSGVSFEAGQFLPATKLWTQAGLQCLSENKLVTVLGHETSPSALATPIQIRNRGTGILEILDETGGRIWSEDEKLLVQEIANQLSLALENAQLYSTVQRELREKIHAEQEILNRNKDLATLNQIGQNLSKLVTPAEIIDLVYKTIGSILDNHDMQFALYQPGSNMLSFPVCTRKGLRINLPERPVKKELVDYVIQSRAPILVTRDLSQTFHDLGIDLPKPVPASCLAVPMVTGNRIVGVIAVFDLEHEDAYTQVQVELLSTIASQATTALENANLFQEIKAALSAIENRERYQANVTKAVATLTEFGTRAMADVLSSLGAAAQCSRIYFAQIHEDERGLYWRVSGDWTDPAVRGLIASAKTPHMPVAMFPNFAVQLREKGWFAATTAELAMPEKQFFESRNIHSILLLAVSGKTSTPSFIAFEQLERDRQWLAEETNVLRVGADALASTIVREDLLDQVQASLDETENLYNASHRLALANDTQEMVSAIMSGLRVPAINRAVLLSFEQDSTGILTAMRVTNTWHSGHSTPPPAVGTEYLRSIYEQLFAISGPAFYDDIVDTSIDPAVQEIFQKQSVRSFAVLPLWAGKRQMGVFLLMSEEKHFFSGREIRFYPPLVDQMATAVENIQLFEQTQSALAETGLLYKISSGIAQATNQSDLVKLVVENIMPKNADRITLVTISENSEGEPTELEVAGYYELHGEYQASGLRFPIAAMEVIRRIGTEVMIVPSIARIEMDPLSRKTFQQLNIQSGCFTPLRAGGRLIGVLLATSRRPTEYSPEEGHVLQVVGNSIAVALERQRLLQEAQRRALELQAAAEIARDTSSTLSLNTLLNRIVNSLVDRFKYYHVSIFLVETEGRFAVATESTGEAGAEMKRRGHKLAVGSKSVVGAVTLKGTPVIINDVNSSPIYYPNPLLPLTRSEIGIPLKSGDKVVGALDIQSADLNAFTADDVTVLQILADQIAVAIDNAKSYELSQLAVEEMREVDRIKSQFLANMSHELRTPLNSIIGFSRVILKGIDGPINETQRQDLSAIYNSGQHLLDLINNILDSSRIEAGKMELQLVDVNLPDIINTAMSTAIGLVKDKPIRLNQIVPPNIPAVKADQTRLRQILLNFVSNAAKFTDEGEITIEASLCTGPTGAPEVMVTVTDTGPGIAPENQNKLFLPFSQVDDSPTRKTGGTGLGLSISRSLVEILGGRIGLLRSEVGKGSTFFFSLPIQPEIPEPLPEPEMLEAEGLVILAIDDDPLVINLYERFLTPHGYRVIPLSESKKAVERAKELQPFAITLDVMMPEKDGWHVIHELKSDPLTRNIPVIFCSILEEEEKGINLGASDYLVKPFLEEELVNSINRLDNGGTIHEILVIDDDPEDRRLVERILGESGRFVVTLAEGGIAGLDSIRSDPPDAIILDLFMPDMNGFTVLETLRTDPSMKDIPVIILTGADLTPEQHKQLTEFGSLLLVKSVLREKELLISLEGALHRLHLQSQPIPAK